MLKWHQMDLLRKLTPDQPILQEPKIAIVMLMVLWMILAMLKLENVTVNVMSRVTNVTHVQLVTILSQIVTNVNVMMKALQLSFVMLPLENVLVKPISLLVIIVMNLYQDTLAFQILKNVTAMKMDQ